MTLTVCLISSFQSIPKGEPSNSKFVTCHWAQTEKLKGCITEFSFTPSLTYLATLWGYERRAIQLVQFGAYPSFVGCHDRMARASPSSYLSRSSISLYSSQNALIFVAKPYVLIRSTRVIDVHLCSLSSVWCRLMASNEAKDTACLSPSVSTLIRSGFTTTPFLIW